MLSLWGLTVLHTYAEVTPLKIGVLACLSGECAHVGTNTVRGARLAVKEINTAGGLFGREVKLIIQDTAESSGAAKAVSAYQQLALEPDLALYLGPTWTTGGMALAPMVANKPLIMISPSLGVADFNKAGPNLFNVWPHDSAAAFKLAEHAIQRGLRRAAVLSSQQPWESAMGHLFIDRFRELGGTIVAFEEPLPNATDLKTECTKIAAKKPDFVLLSNYTDLPKGVRELRMRLPTTPLFAVLLDSNHIQQSGAALAGTITPGYPKPDQEFQKRFQAQYLVPPDISADTAYDAIMLYAQAIRSVKNLEIALLVEVIAKTSFQGASGLITFDAEGGVIRTPTLFKVESGGLIPLE
jgi:branched-chain amino acid transport system substrate-binding protein